MLLGAAKGSTAVVKRLLDAGWPPESVWSKKIQVVEVCVGSVTDKVARPVAEEHETEGEQQQPHREILHSRLDAADGGMSDWEPGNLHNVAGRRCESRTEEPDVQNSAGNSEGEW